MKRPRKEAVWISDIEIMIVHETPMAYKVCREVGQPTFWLPKSQLKILETYGDFRLVSMPDWLHRRVQGFL